MPCDRAGAAFTGPRRPWLRTCLRAFAEWLRVGRWTRGAQLGLVPAGTQEEKTSHWPGKFAQAEPRGHPTLQHGGPWLGLAQSGPGSGGAGPRALGCGVGLGAALSVRMESCPNAQLKGLGTGAVLWVTWGNTRFP